MKKLSNHLILFFILIILLCLSHCGNSSQSQVEAKKMEGKKLEKIRPPAVAGSFYPGDSLTLSKEVSRFFNLAKKKIPPGKIIALVAPHAGYMYSGQVAAYAFKLLEGLQFKTVVVISPSHVAYFPGASIYDGDAYQTPLGIIPVDKNMAQRIANQDEKVYLSDKGHFFKGRGEHALEVELPFLQIVLGKFNLIPIVMGEQDYSICLSLGKALAKSLKDENALIVASTDLSHFHPYDQAMMLDQVVMDDVNAFDPKSLFEHLSAGKCEACGGGPVIATMIAAKELGADKAEVLKSANSGDVTGDRSSVVGYMAAVMYSTDKGSSKANTHKKEEERVGIDLGLSEKDKKTLSDIAWKTIVCKVKGEKLPEFEVDSEILKENRGAFVTIKKGGMLRGCIGYIQAIKPLYITIQEMAEQSALHDPRFPPVGPDELDDLELEISALTPLKKIEDVDQIQVGKHGIYIKCGMYSGLLLPQVATEYNWDRETFLEETCHKAGLSSDCWKQKGTEIYIFSADIF